MQKNNIEGKKTAFIAIVGKPNVGKSSLLNALLGCKLSIVSAKPQTTRTRITGILTKNHTQLVFIDTPGIHKPRTRLGEYMQKTIKSSVTGVDVCILVVDCAKISERELDLIKSFKSSKMPAILAINKIDLIKHKEELLPVILEYTKLYDFEAVVPISALKNFKVNELLDETFKFALPSPFFFDEDALTDMPEKAIVSEIIREKILISLEKEIPHGTAVSIESMKERSDKNILDIDCLIYCEKQSHKGILIGKNGDMIKKILTSARIEIEEFFNTKINLQCFIKVKEDWRNKQGLLKTFGYYE